MRNFNALALLAVATAFATDASTAGDPIVSFGANKVSIDIPTSMTGVQLSSFTGGNCSASDATLAEGQGNLNVEFLITPCDLTMGDEVVFTIGVKTIDDASEFLVLSFFEYRFELSPEYTFTINHSYGNVEVVTSNTSHVQRNRKQAKQSRKWILPKV